MVGADRRATPRPPLSPWLILVCGGLFTVLVATSDRYGYHRDELYFIAAGGHPAFGYPDQPPLVPLLCHAMQVLAPGSLTVLRLPSALAAAVATFVAALVAREVGGGRLGQLLAAGCTAVASIVVVTGHFVTTTTFDVLTTSLFCWLMVRAVLRRSERCLLLAGVTVGIGSELKPQIILVAAVVLAALAVVGPRWPFRSRWLAAGVLAAVVLAAPYLAWQATHGWPQLTIAGNIAGSAEGGRVGFLPFQLLLVSPLLVPVWLAGLVTAWRRRSPRGSLRFLTVTYLALVALYLVGNGKAYYLASLYPVLLGVGAVPVADWTVAGRRSTRPSQTRRAGLLAALGLSGAVTAYIALPLLPAADLQGSAVMAVNPDQGETVGWPDFVTTVATVWRDLPAVQRSRSVIFTENYGEAGAIDLLGRADGLPAAYSGHNGFGEWAIPPTNRTTAVVIGYGSPAAAAPSFTGCTAVARVGNGAGLHNDEYGLPVLVCRAPPSWVGAWPHLTHLD